jgi:hypothetical protein
MPVTTTFPGIYIEEIQSSAHTITAAPTSITVFLGYTHPYKTNVFGKPVEIFSFSDYEREFGGFFDSAVFDAEANLFGDLAQAVNQFFLNGGSHAFVVGLLPEALGGQNGLLPADSSPTAPTLSIGPLTFTAREITDDQHVMTIVVSNATPIGSPPSSPPSGDDTCDVSITYGPPADSPLAGFGAVAETYRQVSLNEYLDAANTKKNSNFVETRIGTPTNPISSLVTVQADLSNGPFQNTTSPPRTVPQILKSDAIIFNASDFTAVLQSDTALDKLAIFNLLVIPGVTDNDSGSVLAVAQAFCEGKRAFLIMDPPRDNSADGTGDPPPSPPTSPLQLPLIEDTFDGNTPGESIPFSKNAALYFPYLKCNNPITGLAKDPATDVPYEVPPSGTVAGVFARTDLNRGVWKAPAGLETTLTNVSDVVDRGRMTDQRQGTLNPLGINCVRSFPGIGPVVFGARTSVANNPSFQQWKYVPVRRMALFLEQTLYANLTWVVFEPNDEPLWAAIRTSIEAFMLGLFRQGAFQGEKPSDAFQVKCDSQTTTQADIDNGIVNIVVGFAPLKPAEFVIIKITQLAGQTQTS